MLQQEQHTCVGQKSRKSENDPREFIKWIQEILDWGIVRNGQVQDWTSWTYVFAKENTDHFPRLPKIDWWKY